MCERCEHYWESDDGRGVCGIPPEVDEDLALAPGIYCGCQEGECEHCGAE